jgi:hypothetical protein
VARLKKKVALRLQTHASRLTHRSTRRKLMWTWQGRVKMSNPFPMGNELPQAARVIPQEFVSFHFTHNHFREMKRILKRKS